MLWATFWWEVESGDDCAIWRDGPRHSRWWFGDGIHFDNFQKHEMYNSFFLSYIHYVFRAKKIESWRIFPLRMGSVAVGAVDPIIRSGIPRADKMLVQSKKIQSPAIRAHFYVQGNDRQLVNKCED